MTQRQSEEKEMNFGEAMNCLKVNESITNLIEEIKAKITRLESMIIRYGTSKRAFEAKEKPLNQMEINQLTIARENFKKQILWCIFQIEKEIDIIYSKFIEKGTVVERVDWSHFEPEINIYIRLKESFERLKNFDKTSQTTTIKT